jgi:Putative collagen-binding domain of a collagenase
VSLELSSMSTKKLKMWWYDPRTGVGELQGVAERENFRSPMHGGDWVLVLDDPSAGYNPPGIS